MTAASEEQGDLTNAKKAVRTFSWKAYAESPDDDLTKSLVVAEASTELKDRWEGTSKEQWMQMFDPATSNAFQYARLELVASE